MNPRIKCLSDAEIHDWLTNRGYPRFHGPQLARWLYQRWATTFAEMTDLPQQLRRELEDHFAPFSLHTRTQARATDGTEKFLFELTDGETIETVLVPAPRRDTVCLSTQVGCPVRCTFCASGRGGLVRDLEPDEIIDQVVFACRHLGRRVTNIVVMGIGEPLLNLDSLVAALEQAGDPEGLAIGARRITVSTSGIPEGIRALAERGLQWNLALSLHAPDDRKRARLIPALHRAPLATIFEACEFYRSRTGRVVTLEYALIRGVNDSDADGCALADIARRLRAKVNLIPLNPTVGTMAAPNAGRTARFEQNLADRGVRVTVRRRKGGEIAAACGQLRHHSSGSASPRDPGATTPQQ